MRSGKFSGVVNLSGSECDGGGCGDGGCAW